MDVSGRTVEEARVIETLRGRIGERQTCFDVFDGYEEVLQAIWTFTARLLGDGGSRAVFARSVLVAGRGASLVRLVRVSQGGADLSGLRNRASEVGCDATEASEALLLLVTRIFETLSELTGAVLTEPLFRQLQRE